jgi:hypothetical protein
LEGEIMATITWEAYVGTPAWTDMGTNRLVFSGSATNINTTVQATTFQDGTHLGNGTPGTDQCGTNHAPNVKILTSTTMSINGGASTAINDTNLADTSCTFRLHFNDAAGYALQNGRLYTYDGTTTTNEAVGVDAAVYVKGEGMTSWFTLNSDTATGPSMSGMSFTTADLGGNNTGEYRSLANRSAAVDHYYYVALSVSPETAGGKANFALGAYLEYY